MATKVTAKDVIKVGKSFLGTKESPANSNNVIFNTHYYGGAVSGSKYPWCAVFLWDIFRLAGASSLYYGGKKCAYCPTLKNYYVSKKQFYHTPKVGDIVFYQFSGNVPNHVGLVTEVISKTKIKSLEGNTAVGNDSNGGEVMERERSTANVVGYARPAYATSSSTSSSKNTNSTSGKTSSSTSKSSYTVEANDTLSDIGSKLGIDWKEIASLNGIKSPYTIKIGQVLKLPSASTSSSTSSKASVSASKSTSSYSAKVTAKSGLNIRKGAGEKYGVIGAIPYGKTIKITSQSNGWGKTTYNKVTGYVYLGYVKKV